MTYSQQPQSQPKPNRLALWVNTRKQQPNHPDYKGHVEISWELLQELSNAFNAGRYGQDYSGRPCIKLDVAVYAQQPSADGKRPVMSGQLSTVAETEHSAAMRAQAKAQNGYQQQAPAQQYAPPQAAPAAPAPMPQQAPAPAYQQPATPQAPAPVAPPMPSAIHGQPPAAPAPAQQLPPGF